MARTRKMTWQKAHAEGIPFRRLMRYDEGFLVNYGSSRAMGLAGARRGRLTPNLAREYERTHDAIEEVLLEGYVSPEQEALEDAHLQARIEAWDRETRESEEEAAYERLYEDEMASVDWRYEEELYLREQEEIDRVWSTMTLVRGWINTRIA